MKRNSIGVIAAASLALGGAAACSQNGFESVVVTKNPSVVAPCEKVADVTAKPGSFDDTDVATQLARAAQSKGANTLFIASDDADKGTAYRCSMPSVAATSKANTAGSH